MRGKWRGLLKVTLKIRLTREMNLLKFGCIVMRKHVLGFCPQAVPFHLYSMT